ILAGSVEAIAEARRLRKMLGGGIRQGGMLAAAGLIALNRIGELSKDHAKAAALAKGLAGLGWVVNTPETNIVLAEVADVNSCLHGLNGVGVRAVPLAGKVRFVTHRDVSTSDISEALRRIKSVA
ncbi:MAG: beta-eliminating lyase-related protein, partial [Sciscionella sp.]